MHQREHDQEPREEGRVEEHDREGRVEKRVAAAQLDHARAELGFHRDVAEHQADSRRGSRDPLECHSMVVRGGGGSADV